MLQPRGRKNRPPIYGMMAQFETAAELSAAAHKAHDAGYTNMDAYSPFPIEDVSHLLAPKRDPQALIILLCAILGGGGIFGLLAWYNTSPFPWNFAYPMNIGGRPNLSWQAFMPPTYEATILLAGFGATFGMILLNGLPRPYHPVFNVPEFARASIDRFFLCIEATDPKFDRQQTQRFLEGLNPLTLAEVPHDQSIHSAAPR